MQTGTYISGAGHALVIGWALFGGTFDTEPLPFEVQDVAVISNAEFAAMMAAVEPPGVAEDPAALEPVDAPQAAPDPAPEPEPEPEITAPEPVQPELVTPPAPPPVEDLAAAEPETRPTPRPSERVAPEAVAPPDPDTTPDIVEQEAVVPEEGEAEVEAEPQEATAPEEAATEIVTEAEEPASAPERSIRPATRPSRPTDVAAAPEEPAEPEDEAPQTDRSAAVDDAVAAALGAASETPQAPVGPPLSAGEKDALRVAVSRCWNVGSLSTEALGTTVVVAVEMQENAQPVSGSIRMMDFSGGSETAARQAFEAARRAIIRCGARGFGLPSEKFAHWREIEMTFNPENMRIR